MLGVISKRVAIFVREFLKPSRCYDEDLKLGKNWRSVFLFYNCTIIRVYGCPYPLYILPKYIPKRLEIVELFW